MKKTPKNILSCTWSSKIKDLDFAYPKGQHARVLLYTLKRARSLNGKNLLEELEEMGFDLATLKFSIKLKKEEE